MTESTPADNALIPEFAVTDIRVSLPFYIDVLGFKILYQRPENGFAMIERQGAQLMLDEINTSGRTWAAAPLEKPFGRGMNLQIQTDKADALYASVQRAGATIFMPIEDKFYRCGDIWLGNRQFIVQDPDGYLLRFAEDIGERDTPP